MNPENTRAFSTPMIAPINAKVGAMMIPHPPYISRPAIPPTIAPRSANASTRFAMIQKIPLGDTLLWSLSGNVRRLF
jgi:hypothetical protein